MLDNGLIKHNIAVDSLYYMRCYVLWIFLDTNPFDGRDYLPDSVWLEKVDVLDFVTRTITKYLYRERPITLR